MEKVMLESSGSHGKGVFAREPIARGERIMTFSGVLFTRDQVDFDDYHLQIGEDMYLGPSRGLDDYVNHSCEPNSGFQSVSEGGYPQSLAGSQMLPVLNLVALRDILSGEEITWDYSTAIDEADFAGFPCSCGASLCRGKVASFRYLPATTQQRIHPWLMPYLQDKYFSSGGA